jgi:hypothetical protein
MGGGGWRRVGGWMLVILGTLAFVNNMRLLVSPDPLVQRSTFALAMTALFGLVLLVAGIYLIRRSPNQ